MPIELVATAKILDLTVCSDLKWNSHIDSIIKKAKKRLYSLSQLKRSGLGTRELDSSVFLHLHSVDHGVCMSCLSRQSSRVPLQWTWGSTKAGRMRISIFPFCSYDESLVESNLIKLSDRRQELVDKQFNEVVRNKDNKLHGLLPALKTPRLNTKTHGNLGPFSVNFLDEQIP